MKLVPLSKRRRGILFFLSIILHFMRKLAPSEDEISPIVAFTHESGQINDIHGWKMDEEKGGMQPRRLEQTGHVADVDVNHFELERGFKSKFHLRDLVAKMLHRQINKL